MELCNQYIYELIKINPTYNDFFSISYQLNDKQPNIYSNSYIQKENKLIEKYYKILKKKKHKTMCDKILFHELKYFNKNIDFNIDYIPLNYDNNIIFTFINQLNGSDSYYFKTDQYYIDFINRLKQLNTITNSMIANMNEGIKKKFVQPKIIILNLINFFNYTLSNGIKTNQISKKFKKKIDTSVDKYLLFNINKINNYLKTKYIKHCRDTIGYYDLKNGVKMYSELIKQFTCNTMNINKILQIANRDILKILENIKSIKLKTKFNGTYDEFKYFILNNKKFKIKSEKQLIQILYSIQDNITKYVLPKYFYNTTEDINYKIKCNNFKESILSPYYIQLFKDTKGTMNINKNTLDHLHINELYVLSLHEGNPGHNYEQVMHEHKEDYILHNNYTCYAEGWDFYVEEFYHGQNLYNILFKYIYELHRLLRLYIDIGIHYHRWSYEYTFSFMKKCTFMDDKSIKNEILRYISDPGQALSYYIGRDIIYYYKKEYLKKNKNKTIKDFHKLFLDIGPCPMDIFIDEMVQLGYSRYN